MNKEIIIFSAIFAGITSFTIAFVLFRIYGKTENKKIIIYRWSIVFIGILLGVSGFIYTNLFATPGLS